MEKALPITPAKGSSFMDKVRELLPKGGNLKHPIRSKKIKR